MTHTDKFKTPPANENYKEKYNKIKWDNVKPCNDKAAQAVVDKLNNACQICHSKLEDGEKDVCQVCMVNLMSDHIPDVKKMVRSSQDQTLIDALKILANDIKSEDGVANACIYEASQRLEELT